MMKLLVSLFAVLLILAPAVDAFACAADDLAAAPAPASAAFSHQVKASEDHGSPKSKTPACPCGGHCHAHQSAYAPIAAYSVKLSIQAASGAVFRTRLLASATLPTPERPPRA